MRDEHGNTMRQRVNWSFGRMVDDQSHQPGSREVRFDVWAQWLKMDAWQSTHYEATLRWGRVAFMQCLGNVQFSLPGAEMDVFFEEMTGNTDRVTQYLRRFQVMCRTGFIFMLTVGLMKSTRRKSRFMTS